MKFLDNYLKKRIKELDEHPELNKNRKITGRVRTLMTKVTSVLTLPVNFASESRFHAYKAFFEQYLV